MATGFTTMICGAWMFGVNLTSDPIQVFRGCRSHLQYWLYSAHMKWRIMQWPDTME